MRINYCEGCGHYDWNCICNKNNQQNSQESVSKITNDTQWEESNLLKHGKMMTQEEYFKEFQATLELMLKTTQSKNKDYAGLTDAFKNFRQIEIITNGSISTEAGILTRLSDKMARIGSLLGKPPDVVNESISDSLLDLAVYAIIMKIYIEFKNNALNSDLRQTGI